MLNWFWPWTWWMGGLATAIRPGLISDCERLAEIHASGFAHAWSRHEMERMLLDRHVIDVQVSQALIGEIVTGFAISRLVMGEAELLTIALDPETRGRGLAKALLAQHAQSVRRAGGETLFLEVAADNAPALALYRGLGFGEIGRRKGYYSGEPGAARRDALTMRADLSGLDPTPRFW